MEVTLDVARSNLVANVRKVTKIMAGLAFIHRYTPIQRKAIWKAFDRTAKKWESRFEQGAADAFEHDKREILAIVNTGKKKSLERKATIDWVDIKSSIQEYLATGGGDNWRKVFAPMIHGIVNEQGRLWSTRLGTQFDVQNLRAREWFNNYTQTFAQPINATTERDIASIMERAQAEGSSIPVIEEQLDSLLGRRCGAGPF